MKKIIGNKKILISIISVFALTIAFTAVALAAGAGVPKINAEEEPVTADVVVTETTAILIATESVDPSAVFVGVSLEDENGQIIYEVAFALDGAEVEVKVDATSGGILAEDKDDAEDEYKDADESEENDEMDNDSIEYEDESGADDALEEGESEEDDDQDIDGIDWQEEGENETEN